MQTLRFVILQVVTPHLHQEQALANMQEMEELVKTYGGEVLHKSVQHKVTPHPGTYVGQGKIDWLKQVVRDEHIDVIVINDIAKSGQLFRLEKELWEVNKNIIVWDRVGIILAIFDLHAKTTEAKLQIELARIKHIGPRVYGLGGTVLSKQAGGIGTRGAGESNSEYEKRHIRRRVQQIESELAKRSTMTSDRIAHRKRNGVKTVALVGYTSAGKTTLFNLLTGRGKQENPMLFTTLDSVVGKIYIPGVQGDVLLSDTIGFIDQLPPFLIEAFRSTLIESVQADVLLLVIDLSDPRFGRKMGVVMDILHDLPAVQRPILIFNKIDAVPAQIIPVLHATFAGIDHVLMSAKSGIGKEELRAVIASKL